MSLITLATRHTLLGAELDWRRATLVITTSTAAIVPVFILAAHVTWDAGTTDFVTMGALFALAHRLTFLCTRWHVTKGARWTGTVLFTTRIAALVPLFIITTRILTGTLSNAVTGGIASKTRLAVTHILLEATLLHLWCARGTCYRPVARLL